MVSLDRCNGSCNTFHDLSSRKCVLHKSVHVNLIVFNMVTRINESKTLIKHTLCDCKCTFDGRKCNWNQKWNNDKCWWGCKTPIKHRICQES